MLTGDAAATDPVCSLAPGRYLIEAHLQRAASPGSSASAAPHYRPHPSEPPGNQTVRIDGRVSDTKAP
jgi:hypothetical protein